jgi:site-specific recombinase XerD
MAASFYLNNKENSSGECVIIASIEFNKVKFKYSTGFTTPKAKWNDKQRVKHTHPNAFDINHHLDKINSIVQTLIIKAKTEGVSLSKEVFKSKIDEALNKKGAKAFGFNEVFELYLKAKVNNKFGTLKGYRSSMAKFRTYLGEINRTATFDMFTVQFYEEYKSWLISLGHVNNTIGKFFKHLGEYMKWAKENGYHNEKYYLKKITDQSDIIYLTEEELLKVVNLELKEEDKLIKIRDRFLLGCYTGLRVSDLMKLRKSNIVDGNIMKDMTKGNGGYIVIPITKAIEGILSKYIEGDELIPKISEDKYREYIKELLRKAGITQKITIVKHSGTKKVEITDEKCELASTHTARKTFITLSYLRGMDDNTIMAITGIKDRDTLKKYKAVPEDHVRKQMMKYWG